jgi:hypothetical protein
VIALPGAAKVSQPAALAERLQDGGDAAAKPGGNHGVDKDAELERAGHGPFDKKGLICPGILRPGRERLPMVITPRVRSPRRTGTASMRAMGSEAL